MARKAYRCKTALKGKNIPSLKVKSHTDSKRYKCYVHYEPNSIGFVRAIKRYCCNCAIGTSSIGCFSLVATVIYFFFHGRYLSKIVQPLEALSALLDFEKAYPVIKEKVRTKIKTNF